MLVELSNCENQEKQFHNFYSFYDYRWNYIHNSYFLEYRPVWIVIHGYYFTFACILVPSLVLGRTLSLILLQKRKATKMEVL